MHRRVLLREIPEVHGDVFRLWQLLPVERIGGLCDFETDEQSAARVGGGGFFPGRLWVVVLDFFASGGVEAFGDMAEPDFEEIGQLRHGADGGARGLDGVGLLDGD